jgi:hypothetical protein
VNLYVTNPLTDPRWSELVRNHPHSSAFHQVGFLQALAKTYGYVPTVVTASGPDCFLRDGLVLCRIRSFLTGKRLVSLPFADHCDPLMSSEGQFCEYAQWLQNAQTTEKLNFVEIRPRITVPSSVLEPGKKYRFHELDLEPNLQKLFSGLHKSSIQRRIQRGEREHLTYEAGTSRAILRSFYKLLAITRRRHRLLPQPLSWFENLLRFMGNNAHIRLASKNGRPLGAILTLHHRNIVMYKYGCSDHKFHSLGVMPFLFWRLIEESKNDGMAAIDFGRSDVEQTSLSGFKEKLGARATTITYLRWPRAGADASPSWLRKSAGLVFSVLPQPAQAVAGRIVYRHVG